MSAVVYVTFLLLQMHWLSCEIVEPQKNALNTIEENDSRPFTITTNRVKENLNDLLEDPIASINIDYLNNAVILQFRRSIPIEENEIEAKRRNALDKNFMRFGRNDKNLMRFGKRQPETDKDQKTISGHQAELRTERSDNDNARNSRGDNFMRFGRSDKSLMRFGRAGNSLMRFGRADQKAQNENLMRFGRSGNLMRFGRGEDRSFMRFGKRGGSLMRFGRSDNDINRSERGDGFMRFGRTTSRLPENADFNYLESEVRGYDVQKPRMQPRDGSLMRFGRSDSNFMRFGKLDQNFMRFGKRIKTEPQAKMEPLMNDLDYLYQVNPENSDDESADNKSRARDLRENDFLENGSEF